MLKPMKLKAIEILVAGGSDEAAAKSARTDRTTIWRWRAEPEFAMVLKNRTFDATIATRGIIGAQARAAAEVSMLATDKLRELVNNPAAATWLQLQTLQTAIKNGRHTNDKFDKDFNKLETVGQVDPERKEAYSECHRTISAWENQDALLARL